jgi:hypothetical protein
MPVVIEAEDAFTILFVVLVLDEDVAAPPAVDRRIDEVAWLTRMVPLVHLLSIRGDQMGLEVERAETYQGFVSLIRVVVDQSRTAGVATHLDSPRDQEASLPSWLTRYAATFCAASGRAGLMLLPDVQLIYLMTFVNSFPMRPCAEILPSGAARLSQTVQLA